MRGKIVAFVALYAILATGCVSKGMHTRTVADLEESREASAQTSDAFDNYKQQAEADIQALEQELARVRASNQVEIDRLTQTHEELTKALEEEIANCTVTTTQVRERVTINMVDRVLFDSGRAVLKSAGVEILRRVSEVLKNTADRQIRVEGHTDDVPLKPRLQKRFLTNWELSTARATSVVRYLIHEAGVAPGNLSAVGYADTRPVATNDTPEGRAENRRIEIVLYPKDFTEVARQVSP